MASVVVIAHNIRSAHNIGAIFRTCEGFGVDELILSGYSPYPEKPHDSRLPHIRTKVTSLIHKTALGAEVTLPFSHHESPPFDELKHRGYKVVALEQSRDSIELNRYTSPQKIALVLGEEVSGIEAALLDSCDETIEIPMHGSKESFNVSVATGIALYAIRYQR